MADVPLHVGPEFDEVLSGVSVILLLRLHFLSHVHFVKLDHRLFELLVVRDVVHRVMHLLLELPFSFVLSFQSLFETPLFSEQTPHAHP